MTTRTRGVMFVDLLVCVRPLVLVCLVYWYRCDRRCSIERWRECMMCIVTYGVLDFSVTYFPQEGLFRVQWRVCFEYRFQEKCTQWVNSIWWVLLTRLSFFHFTSTYNRPVLTLVSNWWWFNYNRIKKGESQGKNVTPELWCTVKPTKLSKWKHIMWRWGRLFFFFFICFSF